MGGNFDPAAFDPNDVVFTDPKKRFNLMKEND